MKRAVFAIIILVALGAVGLGAYKYQHRETSQPGNQSGQQTDEASVRDLVTRFGAAMKNVSILAPDAVNEIRRAYTPFVSADILSYWENNPAKAPGRVTSSPWPERIEILEVQPTDDGAYDVQGKIVEMTSTGPAGDEAIALKVRNVNGTWIITGIQIAVPHTG